LRAKRKTKHLSATDVFGLNGGRWCGTRGSGDYNNTGDIDYGTMDPLDGEEGELVDHDGYFDAISGEVMGRYSCYPFHVVLTLIFIL